MIATFLARMTVGKPVKTGDGAAPWTQRPHRRIDQVIAGAACAALAVVIAGHMPQQATLPPAGERASGDNVTASGPNPDVKAAGGDWVAAGYGGVPYTYPADVTITKRDVTDMTVRGVEWIGMPFKSPIYYGARVQKWSASTPFGAMVDFTHSKAISKRAQRVQLDGKRDGKPLPGEAVIGDLFRHLEFSHGHNMLTLNGLYRLPAIGALLSPYVGAGAGVSLPHSEVGFEDKVSTNRRERQRTYEYQYTGPVAQVLAGLEVRLPKLSVFVEYKFTIAPYDVPLTVRDSEDTLVEDVWLQFMRWWRNEPPKDGRLTTRLTSHQVIGGLGVRFLPAAAK